MKIDESAPWRPWPKPGNKSGPSPYIFSQVQIRQMSVAPMFGARTALTSQIRKQKNVDGLEWRPFKRT